MLNRICVALSWLRSRLAVVAVLGLLLMLAGLPKLANAQDDHDEQEESGKDKDDEFNAHGFNVLRIEQEDKLLVPLEREEEVWRFLYEHFVKDTTTLKQLDPLLTSKASVEDFVDTYFDTPTLQLNALQSSVRHRRRVNLTDSTDRKSGRELMQIKVNHISQNVLDRGEYKFAIKHSEEYKTPEDQHPVLGIIKSSQRRDFKQRLTALGINPYAMKPILTAEDHRRRVYILREHRIFISLTFDHVHSRLLWAKADFIEIEPELNEIIYTEADSITRKHMEEVNTKICRQIEAQFPDIKRDLTPKYNKSFGQFEKQIPLLRLLVLHNLETLEYFVTALALCLAAVIFGGVFFFRKFTSPK